MTEEQIERTVERNFNRYDAALMAGRIDQQAYDLLARETNKWADAQYVALARTSLNRTGY
jgi:hypothetical protein